MILLSAYTDVHMQFVMLKANTINFSGAFTTHNNYTVVLEEVVYSGRMRTFDMYV